MQAVYEKYIKSDKYPFLKIRIIDYKEQCAMCIKLLRRLESLLDYCYVSHKKDTNMNTKASVATSRHVITFEEKDYYQGLIHIFNLQTNKSYTLTTSIYNICYNGYYFLNGLANIIDDDILEV